MCKRSTRIAAIGLVPLALAACGYDNGPETPVYPAQPVTVVTADIDADATMANIVPGKLGMYLEYATGGTWTVMFTCDTVTSGLTCPWSIDALTLDGSAISGINVQLLDSQDVVNHPQPDTLTYDGITTNELDQFSFQVGAGLPVGFDIALQGEPDPNRYVFWIGDGGLNLGISSTSFNLYPNPAK